MTFLGALKNIVIGVPLGVAVITALPIFGAVGAITATGIAVGSALGAACGVADHVNKSRG